MLGGLKMKDRIALVVKIPCFGKYLSSVAINFAASRVVASAEKNFANSHLFVFSSHHLSSGMEAVKHNHPTIIKICWFRSSLKPIKFCHNQMRNELRNKKQSLYKKLKN